MTIGFLAMGLASFGWGTLVDRFGPRPIVLCGTLLIAASLAVASRAATLLEFQIAFGAGLGIGAGAVFAPMITAVIGWFDTRRSLAVSLVSAAPFVRASRHYERDVAIGRALIRSPARHAAA